MDGDLSARHRLVLKMVLDHLRYLEQELAHLDRYLVAAMNPYAWAWRLLQTIPDIDQISAAMIIIEISDDLSLSLSVVGRLVARQQRIRR
jgi:hypothetical protein